MHWIPIRFAFFGDTRTVYDKWQRGDDETVAARDINLHLHGLEYLGVAELPWMAPETDSLAHYVQLDSSARGLRAAAFPTNLGYTLAHETGHYFGLFHTFAGCDAAGDFVDDTAAAGEAADEDTACRGSGLDTCPTMPGLDDVDNFMNYANRGCAATYIVDTDARTDPHPVGEQEGHSTTKLTFLVCNGT